MHHQLGAHEVMEAHEVLTNVIDGVNMYLLYRPHVKDQQLQQILDKQLHHMEQDYQNMVSMLSHHQGMSAERYHSRMTTNAEYARNARSEKQPKFHVKLLIKWESSHVSVPVGSKKKKARETGRVNVARTMTRAISWTTPFMMGNGCPVSERNRSLRTRS